MAFIGDLTGRSAKCFCGATKPSSTSLAFFEFRGEGSQRAKIQCVHCGYYKEAHTAETMAKNQALKCTNFEPHGAFEFDNFYCGCRGWD